VVKGSVSSPAQYGATKELTFPGRSKYAETVGGYPVQSGHPVSASFRGDVSGISLSTFSKDRGLPSGPENPDSRHPPFKNARRPPNNPARGHQAVDLGGDPEPSLRVGTIEGHTLAVGSYSDALNPSRGNARRFRDIQAFNPSLRGNASPIS
jgi:hypothetical protein